MFSLTDSSQRPTWKNVEDDFVMGVCSRGLFGYISRDPEGVWTAFDHDAQAVASAPDLPAVSKTLWSRHLPIHQQQCVPTGRPSWWRRVFGRGPSPGGTTDGSGGGAASAR
ncbi:MAG: hypothetical protein BGO45_00075 [Microbacterium sp. 71-36]|uniref:hypothetical protein n=1 Tax=unclassified Microbacterium TaxID=2609290 RepID=UPI00086B06A8|nr:MULTISPECIES: hypothetical protein [unclassified Microbacterium]MBN9212768.1 hypothetical protein [Microbacterium sp.]ODT38617.1 MAG: hypothetical protein ABS60_09880 [Microbacterium sp. SCN 71-17]ODU52748.1 MAG: hypothetical protein ABT07_00490 [Microbacterium sp. SCN 70-10]OJV76012.1 MAG: hypothetical protein BGO45_00075 [Microbacterium sp. 71-36]